MQGGRKQIILTQTFKLLYSRGPPNVAVMVRFVAQVSGAVIPTVQIHLSWTEMPQTICLGQYGMS